VRDRSGTAGQLSAAAGRSAGDRSDCDGLVPAASLPDMGADVIRSSRSSARTACGWPRQWAKPLWEWAHHCRPILASRHAEPTTAEGLTLLKRLIQTADVVMKRSRSGLGIRSPVGMWCML
jgi:crotonobetainyl-CoA:carnitine CoA-transferase CaiB-like acyl-CoA transferase